MVRAVLESKSCNSITLWDGSDKYSWFNVANAFPGYIDACMFDADMQPKPAYHAVVNVMKEYLNKQ